LISFTKKAWLEQRRLLRLIRNGTSRPGRKLRDFSPGLFLGDADVVGALQVKPELRTRAEPMPEMSHRFERSPLFRRTSPLGDMQKLTKRIGTECMSDGHASLVARPCAIKHAAYSRHIIAWVERITTACPDKLRTSHRNPLGHRAAAHQCPQDIRCNIERECSCSGRM
jgi:hypothetical protein